MDARKEKPQIGMLNALQPIQDNGNGWFKRIVSVDTHAQLVAWNQSPADLEALDRLVGKRVYYYLSPDGTKVRFVNVRGEPAWPFAEVLDDQPKGETTQKPMAREDYWREKEKRDIEREANFARQHYENGRRHYEALVAPGIWKTLPEGATLDQVDAALALILEKAKELHDASL